MKKLEDFKSMEVETKSVYGGLGNPVNTIKYTNVGLCNDDWYSDDNNNNKWDGQEPGTQHVCP